MAKVKLGDYFAARDIEWRIQRCGVKGDKQWGMVLAYVTSRAIMQRLDEAVTPFGWQLRITPVPEMSGFLADIGIKAGEGASAEWIWKGDGSGTTDIESFKGGISGAVKRAAVHWGIGRYLYELDTEFVTITPGKPAGVLKSQMHRIDDKSKGVSGWWANPQLPDRFLPRGERND